MIKAAHDDLQFQVFLARLFGQKGHGTDGVVNVTGYLWRGKAYITTMELIPPVEKPPPIRSLRTL